MRCPQCHRSALVPHRRFEGDAVGLVCHKCGSFFSREFCSASGLPGAKHRKTEAAGPEVQGGGSGRVAPEGGMRRAAPPSRSHFLDRRIGLTSWPLARETRDFATGGKSLESGAAKGEDNF